MQTTFLPDAAQSLSVPQTSGAAHWALTLQSLQTEDMQSGALFSEDGRYRYLLWRVWDDSRPMMTWGMLNPSTASATESDPTVTRCLTRARALGMGAMCVVNLFALRSTDPAALKSCVDEGGDPVGAYNDTHILYAARTSALFVAGWGEHGRLLGRDAEVMRALRSARVPVHCLGTNQSGAPKHPLYVGYDVSPVEYTAHAHPAAHLASVRAGKGGRPVAAPHSAPTQGVPHALSY